MNFGSHLSGFFGRGWSGACIWTAPGLDHGLDAIVTVGEVDVMKEELVVVIVLLEEALVVCVEEMEIDEVNNGEKGNEKGRNGNVGEWENEVISLVYVWESDVAIFDRRDWSRNSNAEMPSFALWEQVKTPIPWKIEVILPSESSDDSGFSAEMETSYNFFIKVVIYFDSGV